MQKHLITTRKGARRLSLLGLIIVSWLAATFLWGQPALAGGPILVGYGNPSTTTPTDPVFIPFAREYVITAAEGSTSYYYPSNDNGTFGARSEVLLGINDGAAIADFDGDGDLDFVIGAGFNSIVLYRNDSNGLFNPVTAASNTPAYFHTQMRAEDFNKDGKMDFTSGSLYSSGAQSVYLNQGNLVFTPVTLDSLWINDSVYGREVGDFNNDGNPDVAILGLHGATTGKVRIYHGNGNGTFQAPVQAVDLVAARPGTYGTSCMAAGDFNSDGNLDLLVGCGYQGTSAGRVYLFAGNGASSFTFTSGPEADGATLYIGAAFQGGIDAYDIDKDGKLDIVSVSPDVPLSFHKGKSDGTFYPRVPVDVQPSGAFGVAASGNRPPVANASGPYNIPEGGSSQLNGSGRDPDNDPLTYSWDLDNNSSFETPGQNPILSAAGRDGPGIQTVALKVCDSYSSCNIKSVPVNISNVPPTVNAGSDATVIPGNTFVSSGSFIDPGADTWTATIDYGDGSGTQPLTLSGKTFNLSHVYSNPGLYTATVIVTDDDLGVGSDTLQIAVVSPDAIPPSTTIRLSGIQGNNGWYRSAVQVTLIATDNPGGSGVAKTEYSFNNTSWILYTGIFSLTSEGVTNVYYRSTDRAGNIEVTKSTPVKIDMTPPEAYNQFSPIAHDLQVFCRDASSGCSAGIAPVTPSSVVSAKWGDEEDDDDKGTAELRTYTITDLAGNTLVLVEKVRKKGHELKAHVVSLQYNSGTPIMAPKNKKGFEWSENKDSSLKELEQELEVGKDKGRQELSAKFNSKDNQTIIKLDAPKQETKVVKPGLVLLRLATDKGRLIIEY